MNSYTYQYIEKHPKETKRLLGIDYEQLKQIIDYGLLLEKKIQEEEQKNQINLIKPGGGRKAKITKEDQIILTLIYLRQHLSFQILGILFQISESTAHERFNYWQKILRKALPSSLIEQGENEGDLENIIKKLSEEILLIDSEEQFIERPSDYETQKKCYSGKKKQHTFKNQIISRKNAKDLVDVVAGEQGPKSDIKICRENLYKLAKEQKMIGDKAYIGEEQITTPQKKPKNSELSSEQKEENKKVSQVRIFVEHLIRIIKIFSITRERFRLKKSKYKDVFLTVCGLVRLRIGGLILKVIKSLDLQETIDVLLSHSLDSNFNFEENQTKNMGFGDSL